MAIFAFESEVRNGEIVVPENVVLPESGTVYVIIPDKESWDSVVSNRNPLAEVEISDGD